MKFDKYAEKFVHWKNIDNFKIIEKVNKIITKKKLVERIHLTIYLEDSDHKVYHFFQTHQLFIDHSYIFLTFLYISLHFRAK